MLISGFRLKDIKDYERFNKVSLLDILNEPLNMNSIGELVKLGNPGMSEEDAYDAIDNYLIDHTLEDIWHEIKDNLLGEDLRFEDSEDRPTKEFKGLTEVFQEMGIDLRAEDDIGLTEYWEMDTRDVYMEFNFLEEKMRRKAQNKLDEAYIQAAMIGQAVWGSLSKEPPKIADRQEENDDSVLESFLKYKEMVEGGIN